VPLGDAVTSGEFVSSGAMRILPVLALILGAATSSAQGRGYDALQPYTRASPDGSWSVAVDPDRRTGQGAANYRVTQSGKPIWSGDKPWTFREAVITDAGFAAGYADTSAGRFHVVILGSDGVVKLDESHARERSKVMHGSPWPWGVGVFDQPDLGRVVFCVAQPEGVSGTHEWWGFGLPNADVVLRKSPQLDSMPRNRRLRAHAVRGTPLTCVRVRGYEAGKSSVHCVLLDEDLEPVWESAALDTWDAGPEPKERVQDEAHDAFTPGVPPGTFAVALPHALVKVRFAVEHVAGAWSAREIGREPWAPSPKPPPLAKFGELPVTELELRGTFPLEGASTEQWALHDIQNFDFVGTDGFRVVRGDVGPADSLLRVDAAGRVLSEKSFELPGALSDLRPAYWWIGPKAWLATQSPFGNGARALAWRIDEETGVATQLTDFDSPSVKAVAGFGDGRFVVLATEHTEFSLEQCLIAFDVEGRRQWRVARDVDGSGPSRLFSPEDVAVTTDGRIVLVDSVRHTLQWFSLEGKIERALDLQEVWGRKPRYPDGVAADLDGGVLIRDFNGEPPLVRMRGDDTVLAAIRPRFPNGKVVDGIMRHARVAPDGRVWATDGQRLLRLDEGGVVDLELGARLDPDLLAEPCAAAIDMQGRALIQDRATAVVHVFDGRGKRLFTCRPDPKDFTNPNVLACLASTRDGGVVAQVSNGRKFIRFGPDGARIGEFQLPKEGSWFAPSPQSDGGYVSGAYSGNGFARVDESMRPQVSFDRAPDGSWLRNAARVAVAPDSAAVVAARAGAGALENSSALLVFDTEDPAVSRTILLPEATPRTYVSAGRKWFVTWSFDGEGLLVSRTTSVRWRFRISRAAEDRSIFMGFDPKTDELLALDPAGMRILRFALP